MTPDIIILKHMDIYFFCKENRMGKRADAVIPYILKHMEQIGEKPPKNIRKYIKENKVYVEEWRAQEDARKAKEKAEKERQRTELIRNVQVKYQAISDAYRQAELLQKQAWEEYNQAKQDALDAGITEIELYKGVR